MHSLATAISIGFPIVIAGLIHVGVIKLRLMPGLARIRLDGGLTFRGRTLFGENKTLRGAVTLIVATMAVVAIQVWATSGSAWATNLQPLFQQQHPLVWGALLGTGYVLGELPNSFVKRQLGIAPGETAHNSSRIVFWTVDQLDSIAGMFLLLLPVWTPTFAVIVALAGVTLIVHPAVAGIMYALGLKQRVG